MQTLNLKKLVIAGFLAVMSLQVFAEGKLVLTVSPLIQSIHVGQDFPAVSAKISNESSNSVTLVKPGDGSEWGWRTPVIGWSVLPATSTNKHPETPVLCHLPRCGNTNPLRLGEVFSLKPGQDKYFSRWEMYTQFEKPGRYRAVFYYQNIPDLKSQGVPLEEDEKGAVEQIKSSTPCKLSSNEIIIEVLP